MAVTHLYLFHFPLSLKNSIFAPNYECNGFYPSRQGEPTVLI